MNENPMCAEWEANGTIARYVTGEAYPSDGEAFEDHFLTCARCQASVRAASAARAHFASGGLSRRGRVFLTPLFLGVAAASVAGVLALRAVHTSQLRELGAVADAPMYLGVPVRATAGPPAMLFDSAATAYNAERYRDAAAMLARLDAQDPEPVATFLLGASHMMLGEPVQAEQVFSRLIGAGDSPYLGEALYYRAKMRLQLGRMSAAEADLRAAVRNGGLAAQPAADILSKLEP